MTNSIGSLKITAATHIGAYPLIQEAYAVATYLDSAKAVINFLWNYISSTLNWASQYELFASYWNYADALADSVLTRLDSALPALKTVSVVGTYHALIQTFTDSLHKLSAALSGPVNSVAQFFDPVLKLTNDYYETVLNLVFPPTTTQKVVSAVGLDEPSTSNTELQRGWALLGETYNRLYSAAANVSQLPNHVSTMYQNELKETKSATQAVQKTTRKLSNDAYATIKPTFDKVVGLTTSTASEASKKAAEVVGAAERAAEPLVEMKDNIAANVASATGVEVH